MAGSTDAGREGWIEIEPETGLSVRLGELYGLMLSPKHTNAVGKEALATKPNGTGPFKLISWTALCPPKALLKVRTSSRLRSADDSSLIGSSNAGAASRLVAGSGADSGLIPTRCR